MNYPISCNQFQLHCVYVRGIKMTVENYVKTTMRHCSICANGLGTDGTSVSKLWWCEEYILGTEFHLNIVYTLHHARLLLLTVSIPLWPHCTHFLMFTFNRAWSTKCLIVKKKKDENFTSHLIYKQRRWGLQTRLRSQIRRIAGTINLEIWFSNLIPWNWPLFPS